MERNNDHESRIDGAAVGSRHTQRKLPECTLSTHHAPAVVTPLAVSAGGGMFSEDDDRLPCGADRNWRHWLRVELSSTLLKYRTALTWQLWKRRPNGVFVQAT